MHTRTSPTWTIHQTASLGFCVPSGWCGGGGAPRDGQRRSSQTSSRRGVIIITNPEPVLPRRRPPGQFLLFPFYSHRFPVRSEAKRPRVKVFMRVTFYSGLRRACTSVHERARASPPPCLCQPKRKQQIHIGAGWPETSWLTLKTWREPFWGRRHRCFNQTLRFLPPA